MANCPHVGVSWLIQEARQSALIAVSLSKTSLWRGRGVLVGVPGQKGALVQGQRRCDSGVGPSCIKLIHHIVYSMTKSCTLCQRHLMLRFTISFLQSPIYNQSLDLYALRRWESRRTWLRSHVCLKSPWMPVLTMSVLQKRRLDQQCLPSSFLLFLQCRVKPLFRICNSETTVSDRGCPGAGSGTSIGFSCSSALS